MKIFCITNKKIPDLEKTNLILAGVGQDDFPKNYLTCKSGESIHFKEKYYSELTFQYWYWKNLLKNETSDWVGFCQKRRFWIKKDSSNLKIDFDNLDEHLLKYPCSNWGGYEAIICRPLKISGAKKIKMIKRGWRSILKNPFIFFYQQKETIEFHFDMHHGHGNLRLAAQCLTEPVKSEFLRYISTNNFYNPHIMFIAKPKIINNWFKDLFSWLFKCEEVFGFEKLHGYDTTRLYAYLAERYLSFWFRKNTKFLEWPYITFDN